MEFVETNKLGDLDGLINSYYQNKQSLDSYKKLTEFQNDNIKKLLKQTENGEYTTLDGLNAKLTIQKRENFDDDMLINRIKQLGFTDIIKTKEYVDMNGLENLIYNGELDGSAIADCRIIKEVETLRVKEKK